jgi:molecular chaperone DnaK (HSP70)
LDTKRNTLLLNSSKLEKPEPVETLAALLLQDVQKSAERDGKGLIKDVVITVPHYFTNNQKQAILDSAKIAQFNVLGF